MQIIVIDDGSTDNPEVILSRYRDKIVVLRQANRGVSSARNVGIKISNGEYVLFLDGDDFISPRMIEVAVETLESDSGVDWVYTKALVLDEAGTILRQYPEAGLVPGEEPPEGNIFSSLFLYHENFMPINAVVVRRKVLNNNLFDERLVGYEDWDLWVRIAARYRAKFVNEVLAFVRSRRNSSQSDFIRFNSDKTRVIRKICDFYPDLTAQRKRVLYKKLADVHRRIAVKYFEEERFCQSVCEFLKGIAVCPFDRKLYVSFASVLLKSVGIRRVKSQS